MPSSSSAKFVCKVCKLLVRTRRAATPGVQTLDQAHGLPGTLALAAQLTVRVTARVARSQTASCLFSNAGDAASGLLCAQHSHTVCKLWL